MSPSNKRSTRAEPGTKRYVGTVVDGEHQVHIERLRSPEEWVIDQPLPLYREVYNHSLGFGWGYLGSGASQLALALLSDVIGPEAAKKNGFYFYFKEAKIASLNENEGWTMTVEDVQTAAEDLYTAQA